MSLYMNAKLNVYPSETEGEAEPGITIMMDMRETTKIAIKLLFFVKMPFGSHIFGKFIFADRPNVAAIFLGDL